MAFSISTRVFSRYVDDLFLNIQVMKTSGSKSHFVGSLNLTSDTPCGS